MPRARAATHAAQQREQERVACRKERRILRLRVTPIVPALEPAKALRSDTSVPTRRRSLRAPRAAESVAATGEPPCGAAVATGPQQEVATAAKATTATTAATSVSPALAPTSGDRAVVVDIPDDDTPPLGGANGRTGLRQPPSLGRGCW
jgi:hypothetical protein